MAEAAELAERLSEAEEQLGQLSALADERDRSVRASAEEVERVRTELRAQAKQLASLLNQAVRRADEREEQVVVLRRQLDQVEQAARGATASRSRRSGSSVSSSGIRARLAVKVLGGANCSRRAASAVPSTIACSRSPRTESRRSSWCRRAQSRPARPWSSTSRRQFRSIRLVPDRPLLIKNPSWSCLPGPSWNARDTMRGASLGLLLVIAFSGCDGTDSGEAISGCCQDGVCRARGGLRLVGSLKCPTGSACTNNECQAICGRTCPNGCCVNGQCVTQQSNSTCGTGGTSCQDCDRSLW